MIINNAFVQLPDDYQEYNKEISKGNYPEKQYINTLILNPAKYREFKRNINRINNVDNEIKYLKYIEQKNLVDFVNIIKITEEEYKTALETAQILFDNLTESKINDLLSHQKLLSNEKHLVEAMVYFLGIDNLEWNSFKLTFNIYEAKQKMKRIDYSKLKKKKINILLSRLCHGDSFESFSSNNDFYDSGIEFVYEWVKCQLKIYFYLWQNKKIKKESAIYNNKYIIHRNNILSNYNRIKMKTYKKDNIFKEYEFIKPEIKSIKRINISKNTGTNFHQRPESVNIDMKRIINSNNFFKQKSNLNNSDTYPKNPKQYKIKKNNSVLMTCIPLSLKQKNDNNNTKQRMIYMPIKAPKKNIKLKGYNAEKYKINKELRNTSMLPFLRNKTFHQMREFFEVTNPINKEIEKRHIKEIKNNSITGEKTKKKLIGLIAKGKTELMEYLPLYKLKQVLAD